MVQRLHEATHEALVHVRRNVYEESDCDQTAENEADLYIYELLGSRKDEDYTGKKEKELSRKDVRV